MVNPKVLPIPMVRIRRMKAPRRMNSKLPQKKPKQKKILPRRKGKKLIPSL